MAIIDFYLIVSEIEYFSCLLAILMSIYKFLICLFPLTFFHLFCVMYSYSNIRAIYTERALTLCSVIFFQFSFVCHLFSFFYRNLRVGKFQFLYVDLFAFVLMVVAYGMLGNASTILTINRQISIQQFSSPPPLFFSILPAHISELP